MLLLIHHRHLPSSSFPHFSAYMTQPLPKKRRLDRNGQPQPEQQSFADVLQQLEAEDENDASTLRSEIVNVPLLTQADSIETSAAWPRPDPPLVNPSVDTLGSFDSTRPLTFADLLPSPVFQQIDVAESTHAEHGTTLRLFGVTSHGNSVLAHVWGFRPYFYVAAPSGFLESDLDALKDNLNVRPQLTQGETC